MTLTYFMTRSAEFAYPKSQVSVYRTIGHLVPLPLSFVLSGEVDEDADEDL